MTVRAMWWFGGETPAARGASETSSSAARVDRPSAGGYSSEVHKRRSSLREVRMFRWCLVGVVVGFAHAASAQTPAPEPVSAAQLVDRIELLERRIAELE